MNVMTKSNLTLTQSGLLEVLLKHQRRKVIQLTRPPTPFLFTYVKRVAAIIAALSFLFVAMVRRLDAPRTAAKLSVLRYAEAGATMERARAT